MADGSMVVDPVNELLERLRTHCVEHGIDAIRASKLLGVSIKTARHWLNPQAVLEHLSSAHTVTITDFLSTPIPSNFVPASRLHRARTISTKRMSKTEIDRGRLLYPYPEGVRRPETRADCLPGGFNEHRPCPYVTCKHHLYLDVNEESGSIKLNHPQLEPGELKHSCALDEAERGGLTLDEVGEIMNFVRERVRQLETKILRKMRQDKRLQAVAQDPTEEPKPTAPIIAHNHWWFNK